MGKRVVPRERIMQISIGFNFRQLEFFNEYPDFKPDKFCRKVIDEQIEQIDPLFLTKLNKEDKNGEKET